MVTEADLREWLQLIAQGKIADAVYLMKRRQEAMSQERVK
jgi:hypothetical protein